MIPRSPAVRRILVGLLGILAVQASFPGPASAYPRPGAAERVSIAQDGSQPNALSTTSVLSPDARYVVFLSSASNLVPGDTNAVADVFLHDRVTRSTSRVSVSSDGAQANNFSNHPAISADGRYVAFHSLASNLVPGDTNGEQDVLQGWDVFVHDRSTRTTQRISVSSEGAQGNGVSPEPSISADGRYVAFYSAASNLIPGDTNVSPDVFVHDRTTGSTARVSVATGGAAGSGLYGSYTPSISADGRYVTFHSAASDLVPGDTNGAWDVFVHDRDTVTTERISVASDGTQANSFSVVPKISADGRFVAFQGYAYNLVPRDTNGVPDIFVHDRNTRVTERVSVASDGTQANFNSVTPAISADGRYVTFQSGASNIVPGDTTGAWDVFVHNRATESTEQILAPGGTQANATSGLPVIAAGGRYVAFSSAASNLVAGDTNGVYDVFVHDRGDSLGILGGPSVRQGQGGVEVSGQATFSGTTIAGSTDPADDGAVAGPIGADALGAELTGAAVIYRPEHEDLLLRLDLSSLPSLPADTALPGVLYGAELRVGETRFEVRALRTAATSDPAQTPYLALYRCAPDCAEHALLKGSFGTTGEQVLISVPLSILGADEGATLSGLRAFTAVGEAGPGVLLPLDEVPLVSSAIPESRVELGIAPGSTTEDQVAFTEEADLLAGAFSGTIPSAGLSPGTYRAWTRACLGDACGPAAFGEVTL